MTIGFIGFSSISNYASAVLWLFTTMDKSEIIPVKLNDKNYKIWSFHLRNFVKGQGLLGILNGSNPIPVVTKSTDKDKVTSTDKDSASIVVIPSCTIKQIE